MPWATVNQSTNRPSNTGGRLEVIVFSNGVRQFFYNYGSDNSGLKVYFRNFDGATSTWLGWHSLADNNDIASLDNNKANIEHTHGEAYSATTLRDNTYCQVLGNIAIVSWWSGSVNISQAGDWVDLWTLPVTNKGKTVWTENIHNNVNGTLYFKVEAGSNKVQALSTLATGSLPHLPGQLVFFID